MGRFEDRIKTVPNQRVIQVSKTPTDKDHLYTKNNLSALDEASSRLQSIGGFKLYIYLAKNQDKYTFAFSSADFQQWSGLGRQAYATAFNELIAEGYLIQDKQQKNKYIFYDKAQDVIKQQIEIDNVVIENNRQFIF